MIKVKTRTFAYILLLYPARRLDGGRQQKIHLHQILAILEAENYIISILRWQSADSCMDSKRIVIGIKIFSHFLRDNCKNIQMP